jgi:hypothetical protein
MNEKLFSGKFWLCNVAALCLFALTLTVCHALWTVGDKEVNNGIASVLAMLTTILTAIITHYFTKQGNPK